MGTEKIVDLLKKVGKYGALVSSLALLIAKTVEEIPQMIQNQDAE